MGGASKTKPAAPSPRGRKPFIAADATVPVRYARAHLAAIDAAAKSADLMRTSWIRRQLDAAAAKPRPWVALGHARGLLEALRGLDGEAALDSVSVRFDAEQGAAVVKAAKAAGMAPSAWIREVTLAGALPDLYRDAARVLALAERLDA